MSTRAGPVVGAIAVVLQQGKALLVKRKYDPDADLWGLPGGKMEHGETFAQCAVRELLEETSIVATAKTHLTTLEIIRKNPDGGIKQHTILGAYFCEYVSGEAKAGDDAAEIAWLSPADLSTTTLILVADVANVVAMAIAVDDEQRP